MAEKKTKAPKTTKPVGKPKPGRPKGSPPARKPAAKKPADKVPNPTLKDKKTPVEPPLLKTGHDMTEKKLAALRGKKETVKFLLRYPLSFFLDAEDNLAAIEDDVAARACPRGYVVSDMELFPYDTNEKKKEIDLLVVARIEKASPPEAEPVPEPETPPAGFLQATEYVDTSAEEAADAGELERKKATEEKAEYVPVKAVVHSDDREVTATFDAAPWFEQATEDNILDLAREEYKYDATSDAVAEFMAARLGEVKEVMDYVAEKNTRLKGKEEGFGCAVDEDQALEWVEKNRPYLLAKLAEIKDGTADAADGADEIVATGASPA